MSEFAKIVRRTISKIKENGNTPVAIMIPERIQIELVDAAIARSGKITGIARVKEAFGLPVVEGERLLIEVKDGDR